MLSGETVSVAGRIYAICSAVVVLLSVVSQLVATLPWFRVPSFNSEYIGSPIYSIETFVVIWFTIEYVVRMLTVWSVPDRAELRRWLLQPPGHNKLASKLSMQWIIVRELKHAISPMSILDVIAIVPFYIDIIETPSGTTALAVVRVLRLARILFLLKLARHSVGLRLLQATLRASAEVLGVLVMFFLFELVLLSSLVFVAEQGTWQPAGPDGPSGFYRPNLVSN